MKVILSLLLLILTVSMFSQGSSINETGTPADSSAMLDISATDKGLLIPRMTSAQRDLIKNPADGLMIYNIEENRLELFNTSTGNWHYLPVVEIYACGDSFTDTRDGQTYNTVLIGTQCWMAENLNIGTRIDGVNDMANNGIIEKYCYDDIPSNCDTYGGLYQWDEVMQYVNTAGTQGICPAGWHVPADFEWCDLEQEIDPTITCSSAGLRGVDGGGQMKEMGTDHWLPPNTGATNASGFTAIPDGYRDETSLFLDFAGGAYFWSSNADGSNAWYRHLSYNSSQVNRNSTDRSFSFSVRCLQD